MSRWRRAAAVACLFVFVVAGCATGPRPVPADRHAAWGQLRERLQALSGWRAEGRLVIKTGRDAGNANFTWVESASGGFRLLLAGPLGQGGGRLRVDAAGAVLTTAEGERHFGPDARVLLRSLYGWDIPVSGLRRWLVGLPGEDADFRLDRFGRLDSLDWQGWHIAYRRYRTVDGLDLPATLVARDADAGTEIRVAIDEWNPDGGDQAPSPESPVPLMGG